jgi:broad specificity phosphatase PhoE/predicted kinase
MCGLPGTGKTTLVSSIARILKWKNNNVNILNLGEVRRSASNFGENPRDFENTEYLDNLALENIQKSIDFLKKDTNYNETLKESISITGGCKNVLIIDATNSTIARRTLIVELCHSKKIQVMFIESLLNTMNYQEFLDTKWIKNKHTDFKNSSDSKEAFNDFTKRIDIYKRRYVPLAKDPNKNKYSYISIDNQGIYNHLLDSYIPLLVSNFVTSKFKTNIGNCIYLCRHGESEANTKGIIGGNYNITENGKKFGKLLGKYMMENEPNGTPIWTSTLIRTINTALECQKAAGGVDDLFRWSCLDEINGGIFEESTFDYVKKEHPQVYNERKKDKFNYTYPGRGGESYSLVCQRLEPVILCLERQSCNILIICHTAILRMLLSYLLDLDREKSTDMEIPLNRVYKIQRDYYNNKVQEIDLVE